MKSENRKINLNNISNTVYSSRIESENKNKIQLKPNKNKNYKINSINTIYIKNQFYKLKTYDHKIIKTKSILNKKIIYEFIINLKKEINYYKNNNKKLWIDKSKLINKLKKNQYNKFNKNPDNYKFILDTIIEEKRLITLQDDIIRTLDLKYKNIDLNEIYSLNNSKKIIMKKKIWKIFKNIIKNKSNSFKSFFVKNSYLYNFLEFCQNKYINLNQLKLNIKNLSIYNKRLYEKLKLKKLFKLDLMKNLENANSNLEKNKLKNLLQEKSELSWMNNQLEAKISKQENIINEKTVQLNDLELELKNKLNKILADKNIINQRINSLISKNKKHTMNLKSFIIIKNNSLKTSMLKENLKLVKKVEFSEIEGLVKETKFKLLIKNTSLEKIINLLIIENTDKISTEELIERFKLKPFSISDNENSIKISRFLIEDNIKNEFEFNIHEKNSINIVKSIIKNLFYPMNFPHKVDYSRIHLKISNFFIKEYEKFIMFKNLMEKGLLINFKDFVNIFKKLNFKLNSQEVNFLEVSLYYYSNKSLDINFNNLKKMLNPNDNCILNKIYDKKFVKIKNSKRKSYRLSQIAHDSNDNNNLNLKNTCINVNFNVINSYKSLNKSNQNLLNI